MAAALASELPGLLSRTLIFPLCLQKLTSVAQKEVNEPWRLSTWPDVSHMPGLERGGAEDVCREL